MVVFVEGEAIDETSVSGLWRGSKIEYPNNLEVLLIQLCPNVSEDTYCNHGEQNKACGCGLHGASILIYKCADS